MVGKMWPVLWTLCAEHLGNKSTHRRNLRLPHDLRIHSQGDRRCHLCGNSAGRSSGFAGKECHPALHLPHFHLQSRGTYSMG
ncbi:GPA33 isoform 3 [Pan troglodytes]|uniref:Glycoprotein A33 n=2 Tax=Homininae TaxID=207598 RepID=E9PMB2_HUMAN|nr:glycoprotein A33 [Homo sapiens]KAI4083806.1 glycoprotein A33 [Homo sapiens]PNI48281.1 GPA33 isoform 3 [Pan troglodytes]